MALPLAPAARAEEAGGAAAAQTSPDAAAAPPKLWMLQCSGAAQGLDCRVVQTLIVQGTGRRLLSVIVRRAAKGEPPGLMLQLPHGLYLPAGATFQIDKGKVEPLQVQTCDDKGCYAGFPVAPAMLQQMQGATTMTVTFQNLEKQTISVNVPMAGFASSYDKMP